jgi:hypothetical protein
MASITSLAGRGSRLSSPGALFDDWVIAETDTSLALEAWRTATPCSKPHAPASYVAALDREEHAAAVLASRLRMAA